MTRSREHNQKVSAVFAELAAVYRSDDALIEAFLDRPHPELENATPRSIMERSEDDAGRILRLVQQRASRYQSEIA